MCKTSQPIRVYSSHSQIRPELEQVSDRHVQQPPIEDSAEWLLAQCIEQHIDLLFCGKHSIYIEQLRDQFAAANIKLVTGAIGTQNHHDIEDKFVFTQICSAAGLPVIPAEKVSNATELVTAINDFKALGQTQLCVKPVIGVFGAGFVQLQDELGYFEHFLNPWQCNTQQFIEAYASHPACDYLLMPFFSGIECSVDIACSQGQIIQKVTRIKHPYYQQCVLDGPCDAWCERLVKLFHCDGLINIQFKQNDTQQWHILEINHRPAGGFAYTLHTGVNLVAELICAKLNLEITELSPRLDQVWVRPVTTTLAVEFAET
ncbi:ATP-grasp domain-containing protein [Acinetobacter calcoaceticus]|uniref:ATP-grasp domain-containing protein n=1 Tax=Acinetobacter calcoaceticus TaxID=471 RepID=A0A4R1XVE8_ACICA|nr:ATP-grasp domain-containing protein [Acinetobacter calcoaceticus]